jgi:hypothetical protein
MSTYVNGNVISEVFVGGVWVNSGNSAKVQKGLVGCIEVGEVSNIMSVVEIVCFSNSIRSLPKGFSVHSVQVWGGYMFLFWVEGWVHDFSFVSSEVGYMILFYMQLILKVGNLHFLIIFSLRIILGFTVLQLLHNLDTGFL